MGLFVQIDRHEDVWRVQLDGVLNYETRVDLRRACRRLLNLPSPKIVMDLEQVTVLDRPGLNMLIRMRREAKSTRGCLVLTRIPPRLSESFEMAGVAEGFVADVTAPTSIRNVVDSCLAAQLARQLPNQWAPRQFAASAPVTSGSWGGSLQPL